MATFEQALAHMREGKKVRLNTWKEGVFIIIGNNFFLLNNGKRFNPRSYDIFSEDWELFE